MPPAHPSPDEAPQRFPATPLFPLPNVVLFPRAVLPLHIFEERYKAMITDALEGNGRIAMALLKPGWEKNYYGHPAIDPIVCVGTILTHERLADGKYNLLLEGIARASILRERKSESYRIADLQTLEEWPAIDLQLDAQRRRIDQLLRENLGGLPGARQFLQMLSSPMSTATIADLIAFHLLDDTGIKQALLGQPDVQRRVTGLVQAMEALSGPSHDSLLSKVRFPSNPSLN